jgi:hypothetical protein
MHDAPPPHTAESQLHPAITITITMNMNRTAISLFSMVSALSTDATIMSDHTLYCHSLLLSTHLTTLLYSCPSHSESTIGHEMTTATDDTQIIFATSRPQIDTIFDGVIKVLLLLSYYYYYYYHGINITSSYGNAYRIITDDGDHNTTYNNHPFQISTVNWFELSLP